MKTQFILNPHAGVARQLESQISMLASLHDVEVSVTERRGDAARCVRAAIDAGVDRVVVAGGDGTVRQALQGMAPDFGAAELAVIPLGTGNDLARSLGLPIDRLDLACDIAFQYDAQPIDLIRIESQDSPASYCINVANGGFGGRVARDVQRTEKKRWGRMAYWMASISNLARLQEYQVRLTLDDRQLETTTLGVAVGNGRFVGGGFPIAPYAILNDGLMDVTTIPVLPTIELMAAGVNFLLTRDHRNDRVRTYRVKRLRLESTPEMPFSLDGEPTQRFDATFEVLPWALRIVAGATAPAFGDRLDGADAAFPMEDQNRLPLSP